MLNLWLQYGPLCFLSRVISNDYYQRLHTSVFQKRRVCTVAKEKYVHFDIKIKAILAYEPWNTFK